MKACVVERFNRTLNELMCRYVPKNNTYRYVDVLQDLVSAQTNTKHRIISIQSFNVSLERPGNFKHIV